MSNFAALELTDLPAAVIFEAERQNNWSSWQDVIVVIKNDDHTFSAVARKLADEFVDGATDQVWTTIHSVDGIIDAQGFVKAVRDCEMELNVDVDWDEVFTGLASLDEKLSKTVEKFIFADE